MFWGAGDGNPIVGGGEGDVGNGVGDAGNGVGDAGTGVGDAGTGVGDVGTGVGDAGTGVEEVNSSEGDMDSVVGGDVGEGDTGGGDGIGGGSSQMVVLSDTYTCWLVDNACCTNFGTSFCKSGSPSSHRYPRYNRCLASSSSEDRSLLGECSAKSSSRSHSDVRRGTVSYGILEKLYGGEEERGRQWSVEG